MLRHFIHIIPGPSSAYNLIQMHKIFALFNTGWCKVVLFLILFFFASRLHFIFTYSFVVILLKYYRDGGKSKIINRSINQHSSIGFDNYFLQNNWRNQLWLKCMFLYSKLMLRLISVDWQMWFVDSDIFTENWFVSKNSLNTGSS